MIGYRNIRNIVVVVVAATLMLGAGGAEPAQAAFDKDELKCRKGIAKNFARAIASAQKITAGCHKSRNRGKKVGPLVDCNDLAQADTKSKFSKAQAKLAAQIVKCTDSGIDDDIRSLFVSCPEPCSTDLGLSNPLTSYAELPGCLSCYAGDMAERLSAAIQGSPAGVPMASKDDQKCHQTIGKRYGKLLKTILKERSKCQDAQDKLGAMTVAETGCATADPKGRIAKATAKALEGIVKSCTAATLANLDSCDATDVPNLTACLAAETNDIGEEAMPAQYELTATICPVAMTATIRAGTPASGPSTATRLEAGWNGIGHGQDLVDAYQVGMAITCANTSPPCGDCAIDGVTDTGTAYQALVRCEEDPSTKCAVPFTTDPVCPGVQTCAYFLGPPYPASASNTPVCILNRLEADVSGTADIDVSGQQESLLQIRAVVHTGIGQTKPCPLCLADITAQDGIRDGTCDGGTRDGLPCDVQGFDATFAAGSGISLDCVPSALSNISGAGLRLDVALTTQSVSLPFGTACDFPLGSFSCACAVCSGDTTVACNSDLECSALGAGTCTSNGGGASRQPNSCSDIAAGCSSIGGELAECASGPSTKFCDGVSRANGEPFLMCQSNADCRVIDIACGDGSFGSCGDCTISKANPCFLDPIDATGTASTTDPVLVSAFCTPPTASTGVNGSTGLPGPTRVTIQNEVSIEY